MKILKLLYILILSFITIGCKKVNKEISERIIRETSEKVSKEVSEEVSELSLKKMTTKTIKEVSWDELIKLIRKDNNLNLANSLENLPSSFQKKIMSLFQNDFDFFRAITTSKTIIDEYAVFCKNAPKATDNIDIFHWFVLNRNAARRFGVPNGIDNIAIQEENSILKFFYKSSNEFIGSYRDGIMTLPPSIDKSRLLTNNSIFRNHLFPNCTYKIKGQFGSYLSYETDKVGKLCKIKANNISPNELNENVIYLQNNLDLGNEWRKYFRKISQTSKGDDVSVECILKYTDKESVPQYAKLDVKVKDRRIVSETFENLDNLSTKIFTTSDNAAILDKWAGKVNLSAKKKANLLSEMSEDEELTKLIHTNPEFNIKRWLNTRNHVDQTKLAKMADGKPVYNGRVYAGNIYYFNPSLNSALKARMNKGNGVVNLKTFGNLTKEELIALDKLYPNGVPFSKEGFPDFTKVAVKDINGKTIKVNIGELTGNSGKDIDIAKKIYQKMGYEEKDGYTWHHIENSTELIRVPTAIHQLIDHAGGMSTHRVTI